MPQAKESSPLHFACRSSQGVSLRWVRRTWWSKPDGATIFFIKCQRFLNKITTKTSFLFLRTLCATFLSCSAPSQVTMETVAKKENGVRNLSSLGAVQTRIKFARTYSHCKSVT